MSLRSEDEVAEVLTLVEDKKMDDTCQRLCPQHILMSSTCPQLRSADDLHQDSTMN